MECLKLIIDKGPKAGESLEYESGSVVKIGRLVRPNTIGIKDAGISSEHISIQFDNEVRKWNLTDLDSSNGTFLNGVLLKPNAPSTLGDGDCIKIGEETTIIVKIELQSTVPPENAVEEPVQKRRRGRPRKLQVQPPKEPAVEPLEELHVPVDAAATGSVHDTSRWDDLEKMTLGDFFDYLEWQLPKQIREKTEEAISHMSQKAAIYREARLHNEGGHGESDPQQFGQFGGGAGGRGGPQQ